MVSARPMTTTRTRRHRQQLNAVDTSNDTPFRTAERYWKSKHRKLEPDWRRALSASAIEWDKFPDSRGRLRGAWRGETNGEPSPPLECWRVLLADLQVLSEWKGKSRAGERDYAIIVPRIPGLVLLPSVLPPALQRDLTREALRHSRSPNRTSLTPHYALPESGLWAAHEAGHSEDLVEALEPNQQLQQITALNIRRERVDFEPVNDQNWRAVEGRGEALVSKSIEKAAAERVREKESATGDSSAASTPKKATVRQLIHKLRWTTIGYEYNWTSKVYEWSRGKMEMPPLTYRCCKDVVRGVPWQLVFDESDLHETKDWPQWRDTYEPEAGVLNFYQLKDSLTAHIDQSEVDAVRPLISFSVGHSAIFLVGGATRDVAPLAIRLDSGDGLIMSGQRGRRVFHGLPRVIADTLPSYLKADYVPEDDQARDHQEADDWSLFGEYLEGGARLNINVRAVFGEKIN